MGASTGDECTASRNDHDRLALLACAKKARELGTRLRENRTGNVARDLIAEFDALRSELYSRGARATIAHYGNLLDEKARAEYDFWDSHEPVTQSIDAQYWQALLDKRQSLEGQLGAHIFHIAECSVPAFAPDERRATVAKLNTKLSRLLTLPRFDVDGKQWSAIGVKKLFDHEDREIRHSAWQARDTFCRQFGDEFNATFEQLALARQAQAESEGYSSYLPLAYRQARSIGYTQEDLVLLRDGVRAHIVPLWQDVLAERAQRLGQDSRSVVDEGRTFATTDTTSHRTLDEVTATALEALCDMHPEARAFITETIEAGLLDLGYRPAKMQTGYCMFIPNRHLAYVSTNYSHHGADIRTIIHELGHAFHFYAARHQPLLDYACPDGEVAELCANGMTALTFPWFGKLFDRGKLRAEEGDFEADALWTLLAPVPQLTLVDHFEHECYAHPDLTRSQRSDLWRDLERHYMPWRTYPASMPHLDRGDTWQLLLQVPPLHTIKYALAALGAIQLFGKARHDLRATIDDYVRMCRAGGSLPFPEVLTLGGLDPVFAPSTLERIALEARTLLLHSR